MNGFTQGSNALLSVFHSVPLLATDVPEYIVSLFPIIVIGVVAQFFWSAVVSILIYRMSKIDRAVERSDDSLHAMAEKLVDERFRAMSHEVREHVQGLVSSLGVMERVIQGMTTRLERGETTFAKLVDGDHALERTMNEAIGKVCKETDRRIESIEKSVHRIELASVQQISELKDQIVTKDDLQRWRREAGNG